MGFFDAFAGGGGGGLLDFLRANALNQQFPGLMASDTAQYGQPMGAMAQAPIMPQQNAQQAPPSGYMPSAAPQQPTQQMAPQQAPQPLQDGSGIGDRLLSGLQGFANAGSPMQALAGGIT